MVCSVRYLQVQSPDQRATLNQGGGILSTVSSIYDPLGILAPVVLSAKKILQDLCRKNLGWDDVVPDSAVQEWRSWLKELRQLESFKVDRCLKPVDFGKVISAQLHHFADACESGYGTVTSLSVCSPSRQHLLDCLQPQY